MDKAEIAKSLTKAKKSLQNKDYGNYWYALNNVSAMMGGADDPKIDDSIINQINSKMGGPGA
jgi:hypothetical protein